MSNIYAYAHLVKSILFFSVFAYVYWQIRNDRYESRMKEDTMTIFGLLSMFFFSATVALFYFGTGSVSNAMSSAAIAAPHLFLFVAMGYMWKVLCSFMFSSYKKYMYAFFAFGIASIIISGGIVAGLVPVMASKIIALSSIPLGLVMSAVGYYTLFRTGPADTEKIFLFTTGVFFISVVSMATNNLYQLEIIGNPLIPISSNIIAGILFGLSMYWSKVEGVEW